MQSLSTETRPLSEESLRQKAKDLHVEYVNLPALKLDKEIGQLIPETMARRSRMVCIGKLDKKITLAMADPDDIFAIDDVRLRTHLDVTAALATSDAIEKAISFIYGDQTAIQEAVKEAMDAADKIEFLKESDEDEKEVVIDTPIIKMVNQIIFKAAEKHASDIHIEPFEKEILVRYRIDGVLHEIMNAPKNLLPAMVSRIKIMSSLKIDEKRMPQDGRIHMLIKELNRDLDIRVSTLPTLSGESVVMRLLDRQNMKVDLNALGIELKMLQDWKNLADHPYGFILITGPTGSGKSTTIYATLNILNSSEVKIVTIEDPIEYSLKGTNQVQVNPKVGLTFATGLRSFLRQDPDIMMVGEIRDRETAAIAIESALTGHLVLSTLHTNTAVGAVTRLLDMGIEPFLISATLLGVLAQRLVRVICQNCKVRLENPPEPLLNAFKEKGIKDYQLFKGKGCQVCAETGYKGRIGIYELYIPSAQAKSIISRGASEDMIEKKALEDGLENLYEDGLRKVAQGITTYEELCRVTSRE